MDGNHDLRRHDLRHRQDDFADSHTIQHTSRAAGRFDICPAHIFQQFVVLPELFKHLPAVQK
jgi:hypothetical protein